MKGRELTFIIIGLLLGAIIGGFVGDLVGSLLPEGSSARDVFTKQANIKLGPANVDLYIFSFVVGITFHINFMSVLGVLLVIIYFRWWYL